MPKGIPEQQTDLSQLTPRWDSILDPYIRKIDFTQLPDGDRKKINATLASNANKNFVQRIISPGNYPVLQQPDGSIATHKMSWATVGGVPTVFPMIVQDPKKGELQAFQTPKEALDYAMQTGEYVQFKDPKDAEWFSKYYKKVWDKPEPKIEARADGGPVKKGEPYLVRETGPELIVPDQNGVVVNPKTTHEWRQGSPPDSFMDKVMNIIDKIRYKKSTDSIGEINTGDTLHNERVYKGLRGIPYETYKSHGIIARGAENANEAIRMAAGLQGYYDPREHKVVILNSSRSPEYTTMHEMTHSRTYGPRHKGAKDYARDLEVRTLSKKEAYRVRTEEMLANAVARRLTPFVESPYLHITQDMFDKVYNEERDRILQEKGLKLER